MAHNEQDNRGNRNIETEREQIRPNKDMPATPEQTPAEGGRTQKSSYGAGTQAE